MLDVAPTELLLVAAVAVIVIGPKDLPKAMRVVGYWVGKMRGVARQFRQGFDDIVREAEFAEMEKKWAEENARIMREFPSTDSFGADPAPTPPPTAALPPPEAHVDDPELLADREAELTAQPTLFDDPAPAAPPPVEPPPAAKPKPKPRAAKPKAAPKPRASRAKKAAS